MAYAIRIHGIKEAIESVKKFPKGFVAEVDAEFEAAARLFERKAKQDAPVDKGFLKNNISMNRIGKMNYEVVSAAHYSAYLEWGTGGLVKVPAELAEYAIQFKGQKTVAGIMPRPFFFVQAPFVEQQLTKRLNNIKVNV